VFLESEGWSLLVARPSKHGDKADNVFYLFVKKS